MRIISNTRKIERNRKIGKYTTIGGLVILGIGLYVNVVSPESYLITFGSLLVGFALSQIGIYYGNRFGKSPRPDELLTGALKGLSEQYTLYHYMTPVPHVLVGPAGVWALLPYSQSGLVSYLAAKNRWRHKGGNLFTKIFAQEGMGKPDIDAKFAIDDLTRFLKKNIETGEIPPVQALAIFTAKKVELDAADAPIDAILLDKTKEFFRKKSKPALPLEQLELVTAALPLE